MKTQLSEKLPERFGGRELDYPNWAGTNATGAYQFIYKTLKIT